jgi:hemerythrin-like metal-binding protein
MLFVRGGLVVRMRERMNGMKTTQPTTLKQFIGGSMVENKLQKLKSVNNDVIDSHHEKIIELFNVLYDNADQLNGELYDELVDELINYTDYHFATEEEYMSEIDYAGADDHLREHRLFAEKLQQLKNAPTVESPQSLSSHSYPGHEVGV